MVQFVVENLCPEVKTLFRPVGSSNCSCVFSGDNHTDARKLNASFPNLMCSNADELFALTCLVFRKVHVCARGKNSCRTREMLYRMRCQTFTDDCRARELVKDLAQRRWSKKTPKVNEKQRNTRTDTQTNNKTITTWFFSSLPSIYWHHWHWHSKQKQISSFFANYTELFLTTETAFHQIWPWFHP